jgi:hypothetical protein
VRALAPLALLLMLTVSLPASAQSRPQIPNSELPGRERDRFFDRFRQPDDLRNDPGIVRGDQVPAAKQRCRRDRSKRRGRC